MTHRRSIKALRQFKAAAQATTLHRDMFRALITICLISSSRGGTDKKTCIDFTNTSVSSLFDVT